jgi:hypothetical protein
MSQHNFTLLLFLDNNKNQQQCYEMFKHLDEMNLSGAKAIASELGIEAPLEWKTKWFDTSIRNEDNCLVLDFEASQYISPPLPLVHELFKIGLNGAVLEVFNDSVCEFCHGYFIEDRAVNKEEMLSKVIGAKESMEEFFGSDYFDKYNGLSEGEMSLEELIKIYIEQE